MGQFYANKGPLQKWYYIDTGSAKAPRLKKRGTKNGIRNNRPTRNSYNERGASGRGTPRGGGAEMAILILLVVLFCGPILRAVGIANKALNSGLDRLENKQKSEVK